LDITVDNSAQIKSVSDVNSDYWFYPGSIDINQTTGAIDDYGSAVCDPNYLGTLAGWIIMVCILTVAGLRQ